MRNAFEKLMLNSGSKVVKIEHSRVRSKRDLLLRLGALLTISLFMCFGLLEKYGIGNKIAYIDIAGLICVGWLLFHIQRSVTYVDRVLNGYKGEPMTAREIGQPYRVYIFKTRFYSRNKFCFHLAMVVFYSVFFVMSDASICITTPLFPVSFIAGGSVFVFGTLYSRYLKVKNNDREHFVTDECVVVYVDESK